MILIQKWHIVNTVYIYLESLGYPSYMNITKVFMAKIFVKINFFMKSLIYFPKITDP